MNSITPTIFNHTHFDVTLEEGLHKIAGTSDKEFEQSFFQLAYEKLQAKLFNLLPFLVGFEVVNKSEDNDKALGVFGFKSNNGQVIYVPAFFINGNVKGIDIMYSKNNEQFYPLNEDFAELFLKDDATGLGDASDETRKQIKQDISTADLQNMVRPPRTGKVSYASVIDYVEKADPLTKVAFYEWFTENDEFCESILRFYPMEKVAKALYIPEDKKEVVEPVVRVVTAEDKFAGLEEAETDAIFSKGYTILDKRAEVSKSNFGLIKYEESFTNPTKPGFYSYLTAHGGLHSAIILPDLLRLDANFSTEEALILDLDSGIKGQCYREKAKNIFTRVQYKVKDYAEVHKLMTEPAEAQPSYDDTYILINENLTATQPFRVRANYKSPDGIRRIEIEVKDDCCHKQGGNSYYSDKGGSKLRKITLVLTKKQGDKIDRQGEYAYVPRGFKLLEVYLGVPGEHSFELPAYGSEGYEAAKAKNKENGEREHQKWEAGKPGGKALLFGALGAINVFPMSVKSNGSEYFVTVGNAKKKYRNAIGAKIGMVLDWGLDEKDGNELVDSVPHMGKTAGYVKLAYTGDYAPAPWDPSPYSNQLGQETYDGVGHQEVLHPGDGYRQDPTRIGIAETTHPEGQSHNSALNQANQMAQSGQKEIFDTQAIATLAKYVTPDTKVQAYMPDFISSLDKLGRMLFLIYWETEKFEELYGRSELPELVELLSNVFKNLGDLVIFLKRKSPDLSINMSKDELSV